MPRTLSVIDEVPEESVTVDVANMKRILDRMEREDPQAHERLLAEVWREVACDLNREVEAAQRVELFMAPTRPLPRACAWSNFSTPIQPLPSLSADGEPGRWRCSMLA